MSERDDHWGPEDEPIVRRLRVERPTPSSLELDRMKTAAMAKAKPSPKAKPLRSARGFRPRSRFVVGLATLGLMVGGTAGTLAASHGSTRGAPAAVAEYHPSCDVLKPGSDDKEKCVEELRKRRCRKLGGGPAKVKACIKAIEEAEETGAPR